MEWLRPFGKPPTSACRVCGESLQSGYVPITKDTNTQIRMRWCAVCRMGWKISDNRTDYRMFQVDGKWRAAPR